MSKNKEQWTYNTDDEYWNNEIYDSKEDAIAAGRENIKDDEPDYYYESSHFSIGKLVHLPRPSIDVEGLLEELGDRLYDEHEQAGEDCFKNVSKEQIGDLHETLNSALNKWMDKHNLDPTRGFFTVEDIEEVPFEEGVN
ncbi:hypothetical protein [Chengkuizengella axinellae]|uniref:Uncharacterized protein n=1 Tax=Chengkuizengella axinellae TaxID=3064388 RepID=A0ABT9J6Z8_9BACL|nr:hypothetical protein [Chengkuizengella sp. 2205SS18-9]MDP5277247.1 hypothetical protein [Chengkuizengella sp. 2205SS18-9]